MKTSELLKEARTLIDTPDKWGKAAYPWVPSSQWMGRKGEGEDRCHCAVTALQAVAHQHHLALNAVEVNDAFDVLWEGAQAAWTDTAFPYAHSITGFNDAKTTTHADVMRVYDWAIAQAERVESES